MVNYARRRLFRMSWQTQCSRGVTPMRPPWSLPEAQFIEACHRCHACIEACPEGVIVSGDGGFPEVRFDRGGCTFCGMCAQACPSGAIDRQKQATPWHLVASISQDCLAKTGVACESCRDVCDVRAIRFTPKLGGWPVPHVDTEACNGCGFCVSVCPVNAVAMTSTIEEPEE
ncbi:MAG: ferredoxin-type protein NapF [Gammaproteobacteria bacterium]|nr:MAG: ferredoxin-type protein NapF [Gammaproteobacteria bacterium]